MVLVRKAWGRMLTAYDGIAHQAKNFNEPFILQRMSDPPQLWGQCSTATCQNTVRARIAKSIPAARTPTFLAHALPIPTMTCPLTAYRFDRFQLLDMTSTMERLTFLVSQLNQVVNRLDRGGNGRWECVIS